MIKKDKRKTAVKHAIVLVITIYLLSGCSSLMLQERKRALDESYEKGKINSVQYHSLKHGLEQKEADLSAAN